MDVVEYKNVYKKYNDFEFINNSFCIKEGRIVGLIGANGAGKTTLINLLLNKIKRDSGSIFVFGKELLHNEIEIKNQIGVVLDDSHLPDSFNIKEIVYFISKIYRNWDEQIFYDYIHQFNLPIDKCVQEFSRGMKKKLEIAIALSHNASLLIFDEPTNGLDVLSRKKFLQILEKEAREHKKTILLSSHIVCDLENIADDIIILNRGVIVLNDTKENIEKNYFILESSVKELKKIQAELEIENVVLENDRAFILIDKKNKKVNCLTDLKCIEKVAKLEDVVYMKIKE